MASDDLEWKLGEISVRPLSSDPTGKRKQARARWSNKYRKNVQISASGTSATAAKNALRAKFDKLKTEHHGGTVALNSKTTVSAAAAVWLDWKRRERLAEGTLKEYSWYVATVIDGGTLSGRALGEVNKVTDIETWLSGIADERGAAAAKQSRKVLGGILHLAERHDAIPASVMSRVRTPKPAPNSAGDRRCPIRGCDGECGTGKRHLDTERAFTLAEAEAVMAAAREIDALPQSRSDIGDLMLFLFSTGARISEALHCVAWDDVDFKAGTVHVRGTKTEKADRILTVSDAMLARLWDRAERWGTEGLVFGHTHWAASTGKAAEDRSHLAGTPRRRDSVLRIIRRVYVKAGVPWAGSHTMRRTVASWMDATAGEGEGGLEGGLAEIANQLGHGDTNVTTRYLGRRAAPTRASKVMVLPSESARGNSRPWLGVNC